MSARKARSTAPEWLRVYASIAILLCLSLSMGMLFLFRLSWQWYNLLLVWLISINVLTFSYYGIDKSRARRNARRIPEIVLHGLAILGGSLGAWLGMSTFRHKTVKGSFRIFFWCIVILQIALIGALIYRYFFH